MLIDGRRQPSVEGVPQGGPLSPVLSNVVLDELDWELHRRGHAPPELVLIDAQIPRPPLRQLAAQLGLRLQHWLARRGREIHGLATGAAATAG